MGILKNSLKSLIFKFKENASINQRKSIAAPQSVFSTSSFSLPNNYYQNAANYADYLNNDDLMQFDDKEDTPTSHNEDFPADDDSFGTAGNYVEAYNPGFKVKIPRPKTQQNPLNIFKLKYNEDNV